MAIGKNKRARSGKLSRRNVKDPFLRKEWYEVMAPNVFKNRRACRTCVMKTTGLKIAADSLKGRVFEVCLAELTGDEEHAYRKMKLRVDDVQGMKCLTNFHGMNLTNDRLRSLVRKYQSMIEAFVDVKTLDGYVIRMFCIGFTAKQENAVRRPGHPLCTYAQTQRIHLIRKRMMDIMTREASNCDLRNLLQKFITEDIAKDIKKSCYGIYPIDNVFIRKVKVLKMPKLDLNKLAEIHEDKAAEDTGMAVNPEEKPAEEEAPVEAPVGDA